MVERPDELSDCILGIDEAPVHVVAGIEQDKNIGSRQQRSRTLRQFPAEECLWVRNRLPARRHKILEFPGDFILFAEGSELLVNPVLTNQEVPRAQTGYIV